LLVRNKRLTGKSLRTASSWGRLISLCSESRADRACDFFRKGEDDDQKNNERRTCPKNGGHIPVPHLQRSDEGDRSSIRASKTPGRPAGLIAGPGGKTGPESACGFNLRPAKKRRIVE